MSKVTLCRYCHEDLKHRTCFDELHACILSETEGQLWQAGESILRHYESDRPGCTPYEEVSGKLKTGMCAPRRLIAATDPALEERTCLPGCRHNATHDDHSVRPKQPQPPELQLPHL